MKTLVPLFTLFLALSMLSLRAAESTDSDQSDDQAPSTTAPTAVGAPAQNSAVITGKFEATAATKDAPEIVGTFASVSGAKYRVLAAADLVKKLNASGAKNVTVRGAVDTKKNTLKIIQMVEMAPVPGYRKRAGF